MLTLPLSPQTGSRDCRPGLTELAARKFVESHGDDALGILGERAAMAEERGHKIAASTWRDLAAAAAHILAACSVTTAGFSAKRAAWRASMAASLRGPISRL